MSDKVQRCDSKQKLWSEGSEVKSQDCCVLTVWTWDLRLACALQHYTPGSLSEWKGSGQEHKALSIHSAWHRASAPQIKDIITTTVTHSPHVIITFTPNCLGASIKNNLASNLIELLKRLGTQIYLILINYGKMAFSSSSFRNSFVCLF